MHDYYLILVIILGILAIADLMVGVSNDAVNFLNSAIGSKVVTFKTLMIIASLGVAFGAISSSGMMEVARKGIFNPEMFIFSEIMIIFLAVMITDILLLDVFNSYGLPTSTTVSIVFELLGAAVIISLIIGISLGLIAGFYRGRVDDIIMWFVNVIWSIPTLLMVIAITLALGKGFWQVFVAVGLTMWVEVARIVRGQVMAIRELEYVEASKVLAYSPFRIITKHILPNVIGPVIVISAANFAAAILIEAGLSFLGIGAQPPIPSWGSIIKDHYSYIIMDKAYLAIIPGVAIMLLVLSFMTIGNSLRDAFDVRD